MAGDISERERIDRDFEATMKTIAQDCNLAKQNVGDRRTWELRQLHARYSDELKIIDGQIFDRMRLARAEYESRLAALRDS